MNVFRCLICGEVSTQQPCFRCSRLRLSGEDLKYLLNEED